MIQLVILAFILGTVFSFFFSHLTHFSREIHQFCLSQSPPSPWEELYSAIVCGSPLSFSPQRESMKQIGVLHIMIVSGAHLSFLSQILRRIFGSQLNQRLELFILFLFVCCCQFQMPALRAWIQRLFFVINEKYKLNHSMATGLLLSLIFCLALSPQEFHRISLLLSGLACMGLQLGRNSFTQSLFCYFLLIPILSTLSAIHPWSILINSLYSPLIGTVLFPASLLSFIIKPISFGTDFIWSWILTSNQILETLTPELQLQSFTVQPLYLWLYLLSLNLILIAFQSRKRSQH